MYTTADKAIVGVLMAAIQGANLLGFHFGIDQATLTAVVAGITPVLVWLVPNLPKD